MIKPCGDFIIVREPSSITLTGATFASNASDFVHGADVYGELMWPDDTTAYLFPFIARTGSRTAGGTLLTNQVTLEAGASFDMKRIWLHNDNPSVSVDLRNGKCGEFGFFTTGNLIFNCAATSTAPIGLYGQSGGNVSLKGIWHGKLMGDIDLRQGDGAFTKDETVALDLNGFQILENSEPVAKISAFPTTGTIPLAVRFQFPGLVGDDCTFFPGDGSSVKVTPGTIVDCEYKNAGSYTAVIYAFKGGKTVSDSIVIQVNPKPGPTPVGGLDIHPILRKAIQSLYGRNRDSLIISAATSLEVSSVIKRVWKPEE